MIQRVEFTVTRHRDAVYVISEAVGIWQYSVKSCSPVPLTHLCVSCSGSRRFCRRKVAVA